MTITSISSRGAYIAGVTGLSAYQVAVANGFSGTISQWLASLVGPPGRAGTTTIAGITDMPSYWKTVFANSGNSFAARQQLVAAAVGRKAVNNANYAVLLSDAYIGFTALTAARTVALPPAANYPAGQPLTIADESGACSATLTITALASGGDTVAGQASITMGAPYQKLTFHCNGSHLWTYS